MLSMIRDIFKYIGNRNSKNNDSFGVDIIKWSVIIIII